MTDPLVLLVDDDEGFLDIARRAIARERIRVDVRFMRSGTDALRFLGLDTGRGGPPANLVAVFTDLDMPGVTGWEILRRVRDNVLTRRLPVVVVSSSSDADDVQRSYGLGANSYLVKDFDAEEPGRYLVQAIRYWCDLNRVPWTSVAAR